MQRIAFFGGTFDPPHRGHLAIARAAADRFALDKVLFAPVGAQPLKPAGADASFLHRYAMTVLATQADKRFYPSLLDAPLENGATSPPNFTVDTLEKLRRSLEASSQPFELFTLLGADSWLQIAQWHDAVRLLSLSDWIVASRPGFSLMNAERALPAGIAAEQKQGSLGGSLELRHSGGNTTRVYLLYDLQEDVSATSLRESFQSSPLDAMALPDAVREYIRKTNLYRPK